MAKSKLPIAPRKPKPAAPETAARFVAGGKTLGSPSAQTSKSVVTRNDGRALRRITVYLPVELARGLLGYCGREDRQISDVIGELVSGLVEHGARNGTS